MTGLISRSFPDNSVVCHANRLSGRSQDNFVTGAALGVNCAEKPLDFFPDVYNEDWLFFASHAAQGQVISVGTARQQPYKPFADPNRAAMEEFGDLIAEGLYALFNDGQSLDAATTGYWNAFIDARRKLIERLIDDLYLIPTHEAAGQAYESMLHAHKQLALISAAECARFVKAWRDDRGAFARTAKDMPRREISPPRASISGSPVGAKPSSGFPTAAARARPEPRSPRGARAAIPGQSRPETHSRIT